MDFELG